jgi:hypothetical protein
MSSMVRRYLESPRARRRSAQLTGLLAVTAAVAVAIALLPGGKKELRVERAVPAQAAHGVEPPPMPKTVRLDRADRSAIDRALDRFVPAAVKRTDPALAFDLVTPTLRAGTTRADWATGSIPVQPFPAVGRRFHHWTLSYSYRNHVGLELLLRPPPTAELGQIAFAVDLRRIHGRWLVDSFIPAAVYAAPGTPPRISAVPDFGASSGAPAPAKARLDPVWFLLPASLLALFLASLTGHALRAWLRGRRAVRAYEAGQQNPRALPPLPAATRSRVVVVRAERNR